jgi:acyl carrier protein
MPQQVKVPAGPPPAVANADVTSIELPGKFSGLPNGQIKSALEEHIRSDIATIMGFTSADKVSVEAPLMEIGLDSLMTVELRNRLGSAFKVDLQPSFIFKYPSISAIAGHLFELHDATKSASAHALQPSFAAQVGTPPTPAPKSAEVLTSSESSNISSMSDDDIRALFLQKSRAS